MPSLVGSEMCIRDSPTFSDVDGDVVFCLASGLGEPDRFTSISVGTIAATVTAAAIRDAVRSAA